MIVAIIIFLVVVVIALALENAALREEQLDNEIDNWDRDN